MKMEALDITTCFMVDDDILNFSLDEEIKDSSSSCSFSLESSNTISFLPDDHSPSFHACVEEELEWLSNKDAFPAVEFDIFSDNISNGIFDHHSPISVLENCSSSSNNSSCANDKENVLINGCGSLLVPINYPVRARSKGRRRRRRTVFAELTGDHCVWGNQVNFKNDKQELALFSLPMSKAKRASIGRRCQHCGVDKTPQWRAGPMGPKTLCNACGVRYKSGRLLPEYRPANSPTFSANLHSNSHRKVLEMRKLKVRVARVHDVCG